MPLLLAYAVGEPCTAGDAHHKLHFRVIMENEAKSILACTLAFPPWEMACQAVPAPSDLELRCKQSTCTKT